MGRIFCDAHVHTKFSCDSETGLAEYCEAAIAKGLGAVCFTDHIDHNAHDEGFGYYDAESFFAEFEEAKKKYRGKLEVLCGIEFAEPHMYGGILAEYSKYPYDFFMGVLHFWYRDLFASQLIKQNVPAEVCYSHYWAEALKAAESGGFDCFGHLDFPKRYYGRLLYDTEAIRDIFKAMIKNGICLEINTSPLRKGLGESMPDRELLTIYESCGGRRVTVGSDAHSAGELAADHKYAAGLIDFFGFEEAVFRNRKS